PAQFPKVEDVGEDTKAQLDAISEGEVDQTCSSSSNASQSSVSQRSERIIEEFQDPSVSTALGNAIAVPATDCNNSNHSSSIIGTCILSCSISQL
ncbi:hypothetical protein Tco_0311289, partial [Tanacetum coccineum]